MLQITAVLRARHIIASLSLITLPLFIVQGCGKSSKGNNPGNPHTVSLPLEGALTDIPLHSEQTVHVQFTLQPPVELGPIATAELDVSATMDHLTITPFLSKRNIGALVPLLSGQQIAQSYIRVGNNPETVCSEGVTYGPFSVSATFFEGASPDVETIELNAPTISIINNGSAVICLEVYSAFEGMFSVSELKGTITEEECAAPANFAGIWSGFYECGNTCGEVFGGTVDILVTQSGNTASYVDASGDRYEGKVCGNVFRFERIGNDEIERGTMTIIDATHAIKRSTWRGRSAPFCAGDCEDQLTRQPVN